MAGGFAADVVKVCNKKRRNKKRGGSHRNNKSYIMYDIVSGKLYRY